MPPRPRRKETECPLRWNLSCPPARRLPPTRPTRRRAPGSITCPTTASTSRRSRSWGRTCTWWNESGGASRSPAPRYPGRPAARCGGRWPACSCPPARTWAARERGSRAGSSSARLSAWRCLPWLSSFAGAAAIWCPPSRSLLCAMRFWRQPTSTAPTPSCNARPATGRASCVRARKRSARRPTPLASSRTDAPGSGRPRKTATSRGDRARPTLARTPLPRPRGGQTEA